MTNHITHPSVKSCAKSSWPIAAGTPSQRPLHVDQRDSSSLTSTRSCAPNRLRPGRRNAHSSTPLSTRDAYVAADAPPSHPVIHRKGPCPKPAITTAFIPSHCRQSFVQEPPPPGDVSWLSVWLASANDPSPPGNLTRRAPTHHRQVAFKTMPSEAALDNIDGQSESTLESLHKLKRASTTRHNLREDFVEHKLPRYVWDETWESTPAANSTPSKRLRRKSSSVLDKLKNLAACGEILLKGKKSDESFVCSSALKVEKRNTRPPSSK